MKNFNQYLNERYELNLNNSIIVDIQPEYKNAMFFNINEFLNYLLKLINYNKKILYYYNGPDMSMSSVRDIIQWLLEYYNFNYKNDEYDEYDSIYNLLYKNIIWIDKSYGFLRDFMDAGIPEDVTLKIIRYMAINKLRSSKEIPKNELYKITNEDINCKEIWFPSFQIDILKQFSGSYIMGGYEHECLREMQLIMNAFNIKYTTFRKFVF